MRNSVPIVLLGVVLCAIVAVSCYTDPRHQSKQYSADNSAPITGISEGNAAQPSQEARAPKQTPIWRILIAWPEGVTTLAILLTLFFIAWQALLTRQAIDSSDKSSKQELRAYLGVSLSGGSFQDRAKKLRFEGIPELINTGKTPAHNVRYKTNSGVLKDPLTLEYPLVPGQNFVGDYVLGMNQTYTIHIVADDYVDPKDVADIMSGTKGKAFHYWGLIEYDDAFGDHHTTEFCHRLYFVPDPKIAGQFKVNGNYIAGRNSVT